MNCEKQYAVATMLRPFRYTVLSLPENIDVNWTVLSAICNSLLSNFRVGNLAVV